MLPSRALRKLTVAILSSAHKHTHTHTHTPTNKPTAMCWVRERAMYLHEREREREREKGREGGREGERATL